MRYSKFLKFASITVLLFCNLSFRNMPTGDSYIEIYFSDKLDISDLASIQANLLKKDTKLNYDYLKFDKYGKLRAIEYHVWYKKVGGSDKTTDTNTEIGFIIDTDVNPNPKYGIIVGKKDEIQKLRVKLESKKQETK